MFTVKTLSTNRKPLAQLCLALSFSGILACGTARAETVPSSFDNPIIKYDTKDPTNEVGDLIYTADPAALVLDDTLYLYSTHDEAVPDGKDYRMYDYRLWTSKDLVTWQNKGAVFRYSDFPWARGDQKTGNAYAHHVIHRKDASGKSKYYFYAAVEGGQTEGKFGFSIGVAVSDSPEGPFKDARGMPMILLEDTAKDKDHTWRNIDPAVFIDDDGKAYLYWGNQQLWWVELEADLVHLKGESYSLDAEGKMQNRDTSKVKSMLSTPCLISRKAPTCQNTTASIIWCMRRVFRKAWPMPPAHPPQAHGNTRASLWNLCLTPPLSIRRCLILKATPISLITVPTCREVAITAVQSASTGCISIKTALLNP